jgi:hypothetical protein
MDTSTDQAPWSHTPYREYLGEVLPQLGLSHLLIEDTPTGDTLDLIAGQSPIRPPWGLNLSGERVQQLVTAFTAPRINRSLVNSASPFRLVHQAYKGVFKAPALDTYLVVQGQQASKTKAAPHALVNTWAKQLGPLYEAHMATFRLAHHQSILTQALHQSLGPDASALTKASITFLAQSEKELMATSASAASHCIALQRTMHLGVTTYTSHTR